MPANRTNLSSGIGVYTPTKTELAAIRKGRAEIKRGHSVTLEQLLHEMDNPNRKASTKRTRKSSR
jgi:hypothetical protein